MSLMSGISHNDPMFAVIISTILLILAVVLVVLTRLRLATPQAPLAGNLDIPRTLVNAHTVTGALGIVLWGAYVFTDVAGWVGVLGLLLWWVTTVIGLLILARWLPAKGKHASEGVTDSWTEGPWLSVLGHVGALVGAVVWTVFLALGSLA